MADDPTATAAAKARQFRVKSANGRPPQREFFRSCNRCHADFLGLAFGKTGLIGVWNNTGRWWCSIECYDTEHGTGEADRLITGADRQVEDGSWLPL